MTRLFQRLEAGEMALGVWLKSGPTWVSTIAQAGFDFVRPDMMFSAMDWTQLDHIHRTALAAGITTWVRVPANPWLAGAAQLQVTVDVQRAFAMGIQSRCVDRIRRAGSRVCGSLQRLAPLRNRRVSELGCELCSHAPKIREHRHFRAAHRSGNG